MPTTPARLPRSAVLIPAAASAALALALVIAAPGEARAQAAKPTAPAPPVAANAPGNPGTPAVRTDDPRLPPDAARTQPAVAGALADDYKIGPQDLLDIQVFGIENLKREVRVNSRGAVSLPLIGTVALGGLTSQEAETLIAEKYAKDYLQDPQVSVFIKEFTSQRITVEGAVVKPGIYPIRGETTLLQAIALAGGQGTLSDMKEVMVYRREAGERKMYTYDLIKIRGGEERDPVLANEDVVVIKRDAGRVALRDSILGDMINIVNPFNYLPRY